MANYAAEVLVRQRESHTLSRDRITRQTHCHKPYVTRRREPHGFAEIASHAESSSRQVLKSEAWTPSMASNGSTAAELAEGLRHRDSLDEIDGSEHLQNSRQHLLGDGSNDGHLHRDAEVGTQPDPHSLEQHKSITYLNGVALSVGLIIGSGIFASPSEVSVNIGSPAGSLAVWVLAGLLAWTGAASYAELGSAIPHNGGMPVYLAFVYREVPAFLYTWGAVLVLRPVSLGIISIVMGKYVLRAMIGASFEELDPVAYKSIALVTILVITSLNSLSTRIGTRIADVLMWFKFFALSAIILTGLAVALFGERRAKPRVPVLESSIDLSSLVMALYAALWAYDGWDIINFVAGEMRNARRDLPRVIHTTIPLVMTFFVLANAAYFVVLPDDIVNSSKTIAIDFGRAAFGETGAILFALAVGISCFGALNSSVISNGRMVHASARKEYLPEMLGHLGLPARSKDVETPNGKLQSHLETAFSCFGDAEQLKIGLTPISAMILLLVTATCYILLGDFGSLLIFGGIFSYSFHFMTIFGLVVLRIQQPNLDRPYRAWITSPLIFCCICVFLVVQGVQKSTTAAVAGVAFLFIGTGAHRVWFSRP